MEPVKTGGILIVDDLPANLELLGGMLRSQGVKIRVAPDGRRALTAMEQVIPDLVLLDINMPEMDGYEVCARMKASERLGAIPVIFLSARTDVEDKVKAFRVGGVDYITKPFQTEEVLARVAAHLNLRRLQRELTRLNEELEERVRVRTAEVVELSAAYARFVPEEFLGLLEKESILDVRLGDQVQRDMTVMFTDIRNFTTLSEASTPQISFDFLNTYLGRISPVVRRNSGFIDKFIGDAVMALFPGSVDEAVCGAIEAVREVNGFSEYLVSNGQPALRTGTGLHTGSVMLGIIGAEDRFQAAINTHGVGPTHSDRYQATVISDAVNTASRLESLTKLYGVDILASEDVIDSLTDRSNCVHRFLGTLKVKGKERPVRVHEIFEVNESPESARKLETMSTFQEGLQRYYEKRFAEAAVKFDAASRGCPEDVAYKLYLKRAAHFLGNGVPENWTGVE